MTKKFLVFGMAAILGASLSFFACENPTDGAAGSPGRLGPGVVSGEISVAGLQTMLDLYDGMGTELVLADVELSDAGTVNFKSVKAYIAGAFTTAAGGTIINAANATVTFADGASIVATANTDDIIIGPVGADDFAANVSGGGTVPAYAASVDPTNPIDGDTVLLSLNLSGSGTSVTDFGTWARANTVYVAGGLVIDAGTAFSTDSAKLVALGETTASGTGGITFGADTVIGTLKATGALTITAVGAGGIANLDLNDKAVTIADDEENIANITGGGSLALPATPTVPKITVGATDITVTGTGASLTVSAFSTGTGKLVIPASAVAFTATAGGGNFAYAAAPANATLISTTGLTHVGNLSTAALTTSAGALTVTGNLTTTSAASIAANLTVTGTANFGTTLTNTAAAVATFNGATTVTGILTTGEGGLTIAGTGAVTLTAVPVTTTVGLTVKSTGGVTLSAETVIAANVKATKATVKGTAAAGTLIKSTGTALTVGADNSVDVTASGAQIVAGGETGSVTITGATLAGGDFTATDSATATLTLGANAVLSAEGSGTVTIGTAGQIVLTDDTSKINLVDGGSLVAPAAGDLVKTGGNATAVTLTVSATGNAAATYATVSEATPFTVTTAATAGTGSQKVTVGKVSWTVSKEAAVNAQTGAAETDAAAAGTLKAGAGTTLVITATA